MHVLEWDGSVQRATCVCTTIGWKYAWLYMTYVALAGYRLRFSALHMFVRCWGCFANGCYNNAGTIISAGKHVSPPQLET